MMGSHHLCKSKCLHLVPKVLVWPVWAALPAASRPSLQLPHSLIPTRPTCSWALPPAISTSQNLSRPLHAKTSTAAPRILLSLLLRTFPALVWFPPPDISWAQKLLRRGWSSAHSFLTIWPLAIVCFLGLGLLNCKTDVEMSPEGPTNLLPCLGCSEGSVHGSSAVWVAPSWVPSTLSPRNSRSSSKSVTAWLNLLTPLGCSHYHIWFRYLENSYFFLVSQNQELT